MPDDLNRLTALGWAASWQEQFEPWAAQGLVPARIAVEDRRCYGVLTAQEDLPARVAGKLLHQCPSKASLPKVGDWVAAAIVPGEKKAVIHQVLPRKTSLRRKTPGRQIEEQVLAANVDVVLVVQALDRAFNPRRLQRQLVMVMDSGAEPVVVLNKTDLCPELQELKAAAVRAAGALPVISVSARTGDSMESLRPWLRPGLTVAFIGPSGVGKSTLINRLYGEDIQDTQEVRASDAKGRHTTTWRELILLPEGGVVIDTPGLRELHLWGAGEGLQEAFPEIEALGLECHFPGCTHVSETKCAVLNALRSGQLVQDHYDSYLKLKRDFDFLEKAKTRPGYAAQLAKARFSRKTRR